MDKAFNSPQTVEQGSPVRLLYYSDAQPNVLECTVAHLGTLSLQTSDSRAAGLRSGQRAMLISQGQKVAKAECEVVASQAQGDAWYVELAVQAWEEVDRRQYPRYRRQFPVKIRHIEDNGEGSRFNEVFTETEDISLGGALVVNPVGIEAGSLIEVQAELRPRERLRALAVAVRVEDGLMGLQFLDFVGASRFLLHNFLAEAA